jgi:tousled-like kinase
VSSKVDIWSIGVIFYEMLYGKRPFGHGFSQSKIISQGVILNATKVEFPNQSPKKYRISEEAKNFICECLKYDQSERLSPL